MKKILLKQLSRLIPRGNNKEKIKLFFYSLTSKKGLKFRLETFGDSIVYHTEYNSIKICTNEALYHVAPDFDYYLHFYKINKGDIIIDGGANLGYLSLYFSKLTGDTGKVFSFEPDTKNIIRMNKNIRLNENPICNNILVQEFLLWNKNTWIDFNEEGTVGSSAIWMPESSNIIKKEAITIDDWVFKHNLDRLDFIKMDIEGAEIEAIEGCLKCIENYNTNFAIASYHIVNGEPTFIKLEAFFKSINYPFKTIRFNKNEIITFAGPSVKND